MTRLFVDGASGTVGMALQPHLTHLLAEGLVQQVHTLSPEQHRESAARQAAMAEADLVVLCLPDEIAPPAVDMALAANPAIRILDASAAHRCAPGWTYGLPEVTPAAEIAAAQFVANPGCFATGCILLARPLHQLLSHQAGNPLPWAAFQGITGYSAGGMKAQPHDSMPYLTQLGKAHRHLPEIERYARVKPHLTTMVGNWRHGMLVQLAVDLPVADVLQAYYATYAGTPVEVSLAGDGHRRLSVQESRGHDSAHIMVAEQPHGSTVAIQFDNLGKGSAGAAAENLRLMLSTARRQALPEETVSC